MAELARLHIIVKGLVQGVGYRYFVLHVARGYGLTGFVRNKENGTVEVEAEGDESVLQAFMKDLRVGPFSAEVSGLDVERLPPRKGSKGFDIRF